MPFHSVVVRIDAVGLVFLSNNAVLDSGSFLKFSLLTPHRTNPFFFPVFCAFPCQSCHLIYYIPGPQ